MLDPGEEFWEGIEIEAVHDVDYLSEAAFERLMTSAVRLLLQESPLEGKLGIDAGTRAEIEGLLAEVAARQRSAT